MEAKFQLLKSETLPLTLKLAEEFRDLKPSPTERDPNPARLKYLTEKAEAGLFVSPTWATAQLGENLMRVNGQHSSTALCGLNGNFPDGLQVHIDRYQVKDQNELALLFQQFDARKSGRSSADVAGAYQGLQENLRSIPKATAKLGVDGVVWWRRNVEGVPVAAGDQSYELFAETGLHPYLHWLGDIFTIKTPEMRSPPVAAAMYATFIASETNARTFWAEVARGGAEYEEDSPSTALDNWLKELREDRGDVKPANMYNGCIYAWNAYRGGRKIASVKSDTKKGLLKASE